jgi:hypothetical protein
LPFTEFLKNIENKDTVRDARIVADESTPSPETPPGYRLLEAPTNRQMYRSGELVHTRTSRFVAGTLLIVTVLKPNASWVIDRRRMVLGVQWCFLLMIATRPV